MIHKMKDVAYRFINNNITFYVVVPFLILVLGWIKNEYDRINQRTNIRVGEYRNVCPFLKLYNHFLTPIYSYDSLVMVVYAIIECYLAKIQRQVKEIFYIVTCILGIIYLVVVAKNLKYRIELLKHRKCKIIYFALTEIIQIIPIAYYENNNLAYVWCGIIIGMYCLANIFSDHIVIYYNRYVSLTLIDGKKLKDIRIDKINTKRKWLLIDTTKNDEIGEVRIKESSVVKIEYYGGEYIKVYCPILKWLRLEDNEE